MNSKNKLGGRELTALDIANMGYSHARQCSDGRWLAVAPMTFGKGRLYFDLDFIGFESCYCYASMAEAINAMEAFNPETDKEPDGWFKSPTDNRIRPGGDKSKETIGYQPD